MSCMNVRTKINLFFRSCLGVSQQLNFTAFNPFLAKLPEMDETFKVLFSFYGHYRKTAF